MDKRPFSTGTDLKTVSSTFWVAFYAKAMRNSLKKALLKGRAKHQAFFNKTQLPTGHPLGFGLTISANHTWPSALLQVLMANIANYFCGCVMRIRKRKAIRISKVCVCV